MIKGRKFKSSVSYEDMQKMHKMIEKLVDAWIIQDIQLACDEKNDKAFNNVLDKLISNEIQLDGVVNEYKKELSQWAEKNL